MTQNGKSVPTTAAWCPSPTQQQFLTRLYDALYPRTPTRITGSSPQMCADSLGRLRDSGAQSFGIALSQGLGGRTEGDRIRQ
ncbi:hypothetical protein BBOMB_0120 [Bifidobacterium bombi DSM 19703]|uniref:Uncharacterized protein n=1 Tax=Bifidobacterium bombi DSM 19703 TaxID=1341695 RepID=A0A080N1U4_9BIFI|nr:hypothetical protein BBOMB_0120 [Bifidobacterium bombi DSM 19703]